MATHIVPIAPCASHDEPTCDTFARFESGLDVGPPADFGPLVAPNPQNVCFPPHYARTFTIETDIDVIVETVTANGTARQPVIVPSRAAFSCDVWEFVRLTAAANQALPVVSWTGDTEVLL